MTRLFAILITLVVGAVSNPSPATDSASYVSKPSLEGQSVLFVGDSVCYGTNYEGGYGKIIAEDEGMDVTNGAKGGASVARNVKWSADSDGTRPCIIDMINGADGDYDYIIAEGGINDFWNHAPLGELTSGFDGEYDEETFAGALESIFSIIREEHPESTAGFVITHDPFTYDAEEGFAPYYETIKKACDKWSVPYLDLYEKNNQNEGVNVRSKDDMLAYFASEARPEGDGMHPNEAGYRKIYVLPIAEWLKGMTK